VALTPLAMRGVLLFPSHSCTFAVSAATVISHYIYLKTLTTALLYDRVTCRGAIDNNTQACPPVRDTECFGYQVGWFPEHSVST